jgi:hypothetical protein
MLRAGAAFEDRVLVTSFDDSDRECLQHRWLWSPPINDRVD